MVLVIHYVSDGYREAIGMSLALRKCIVVRGIIQAQKCNMISTLD